MWVPSHSTLLGHQLCPASKQGGCSESFFWLPLGIRGSSHCQQKVGTTPSTVPSWLSWDLPGFLQFLFCSAAEKEEEDNEM